MAQLRLTVQFAKDLKITLNKRPKETLHSLDDWIADIFRVERKKVAIVTHVKTLISFIFPYAEVGGAKNVLGFLPVDIEHYLRDQNLEGFVPLINEIFNQPPVFTKTENQKILGHMNDFKRTIIFLHRYRDVHWHDISNTLKGMPVNFKGSFTTPEELLRDCLNSTRLALIK